MKIQANFLGFTLVEMAVVLVIVGLMLGGFLMPLSAQIDQRNFSETQKSLSDIKDALMGYAMSHPATDGHPYLPCPDTDGDGAENRTAGVCTNTYGDLPWADLGLYGKDSWNNLYGYRVSNAFSDNTTGFTLSSSGNITIKDASGGNNLASSVPVVIFSKGKNGAGSGADESENSNNDATFVSHTPASTSGNEFDDIVVWLPTAILLNRMVAAGKLP